MRHLFISDVHLGGFKEEENQQIESDLISLIDFCQNQDIHIHILGDLFDYWMEYPEFIPEIGKKTLLRLKEYNQKVKAITYITGNHDNWTSGYFEELDFDVEPEFKLTLIDKNRVLLMHGDGLADPKMNLKRPILHRFLRNKQFISLYKSILPAKTGIYTMKWFSQISKTGRKPSPDKLTNWAAKFLEKEECDVVICGHDHVPRVETFSFGTYINIGTFFKHRSVCLYTKNSFDLVFWNSSERRFESFTQFKQVQT